MQRGLVDAKPSEEGIQFSASEAAGSIVACLEEGYTRGLRERAEWVHSQYDQVEESDLMDFFTNHLDRWGAEFEPIGDLGGDE